jgi:hypothetical protein
MSNNNIPFIFYLNNSKLFAGFIMILMNLGGRYVSNDISKSANNILNTKLIRNFLVFSMAFIATRDVISSTIIVLLFILVFRYFLNEKSKYCILPDNYVINIDENGDGIISNEEIQKSKELLDRIYTIHKNKNNLNR